MALLIKSHEEHILQIPAPPLRGECVPVEIAVGVQQVRGLLNGIHFCCAQTILNLLQETRWIG